MIKNEYNYIRLYRNSKTKEIKNYSYKTDIQYLIQNQYLK
jgi:hypothetical protein